MKDKQTEDYFQKKRRKWSPELHVGCTLGNMENT